MHSASEPSLGLVSVCCDPKKSLYLSFFLKSLSKCPLFPAAGNSNKLNKPCTQVEKSLYILLSPASARLVKRGRKRSFQIQDLCHGRGRHLALTHADNSITLKTQKGTDSHQMSSGSKLLGRCREKVYSYHQRDPHSPNSPVRGSSLGLQV